MFLTMRRLDLKQCDEVAHQHRARAYKWGVLYSRRARRKTSIKYHRTPTNAVEAMPTFGGGGEKCILCAKSVYPAEKVTTNSGNIFHKNCCRCTKCDRVLTCATASESSTTHRLYCKVHYEEIRTTSASEASAPLVLAAKKVELEEEVETLHEGAKAWVELAPSLLTSVPALTPAEGSAECFVRATVSKIDGDKCVVKTEGGVECTVPSKLVMKADGGGAQSNNLMLVELNEPSLLHNLRARFDGGSVYTYTGELELMCLNPYERLPCYEEQVMQQCKDGTYPEPHIWALTERIFKALSDKGTLAQSVVVSGESGAGKRSPTPPGPDLLLADPS